MQIVELDETCERAFLASVGDWARDPDLFVEDFLGSVKEWGPSAFKKSVKIWQKERMDWRPKASKSSLSRYALVNDAGEMLAFGLLRFPLDPMTEVDGGNLSCYVPASRRRKGYGSYCLALLLFEAVRAGLRRVLVTCPADDVGARRIIEMNRGRHEDTLPSNDPRRKGERISRYWIEFS